MTPTPDLGVDLDRLLELAEKARPGPWPTFDDVRKADAAYIAALSPDVVSELIRRLRAAEARGLDVERMRAVLRENGWYVADVMNTNWVESSEWGPVVIAALRESTDV